MSEHVFRRKAYQTMLQWKKESQGETALLVEGARRVGKSTLVRQFARNEYKSYVLFDFSKASKEEDAPEMDEKRPNRENRMGPDGAPSPERRGGRPERFDGGSGGFGGPGGPAGPGGRW